MKPMETMIALTQLLNTILGGYAHETTSSRAYRLKDTSTGWKYFHAFIDGMFFWQDQHCKASHDAWRERIKRHAELHKSP